MSACWAARMRDGAAHELHDDGSDVGVGDVLAAAERGEPDRAVLLGPVERARHAVREAGAGAAPDGRRQLFLTHGDEPVEQRDVDLLAAAEVVVHEPARDAGGVRDVLDRDLVVAALGEQRVGRVEDLFAALPGSRAGCTSPSCS